MTGATRDLADIPDTDNPEHEGGAYTTAAAYGQLLLMHLRDGQCPNGRVLAAESVARMQEDRVAEWGGTTNLGGPFEGYGLGWWIDGNDPGVVSDGGAFGSMPWIDNNRGYAVIIILESGNRAASVPAAVRPFADAAIDAAFWP